jgi:membrane protease YdiL (CAAX protease family)
MIKLLDEVSLKNDDNIGYNPRKVFSRIGYILAIMLILVQVIETIFYKITSAAVPQLWDKPWMTWVMISIGFYCTAFPVYCILMKKIPDSPKEAPKRLSVVNLVIIFAIGMAALYIFNFISMILNSFLGSLKGELISNPLEKAINSSSFFYTLVFVGIIAPVIEEIIFRGILLNKIRRYGDKTALWISAFAFGFFHLNTSQIIYATALGLIFGYVALKTNGIQYSIILHMAINIMGSVVAPTLATAGYLTVVGLIVIVFVVIGSVLFFLLRRTIVLYEGSQPIDKTERLGVIFGNVGIPLYFGLCIILIILMTIL